MVSLNFTMPQKNSGQVGTRPARPVRTPMATNKYTRTWALRRDSHIIDISAAYNLEGNSKE
jgi:hypothetical protein